MPGYPTGWTGYKVAGTGAMAAGTEVTSGTSPALTVGNGTGTAGTIYNFGTTSDADRALGSLASAGFQGAFGVSIVNNTGVGLEGVNVQLGFRSELWRSGNNAGTDTWIFEWKLGGSITDSVGWQPASTFDITELQPTLTTSGPQDGNATGNFVDLTPTTLAGLTGWSNGQVLHLRWRDVDNTGSDSGMAIDDFQFIVSGVTPPAPQLHWDANGATAGAGGPTPSGVWGTDAFWSASPAGDAATVGWTADADAVFSAGSDATGAFTVTLSGTQSAGGVLFEDGVVTLSGGTLVLSDVTPSVFVDAAAAAIESIIDGSNGLLKQGPGTLTLSGVNTFAGSVNIGAGTLSISSDAALGAAENDLLINGTLVTSASMTLASSRDISGAGTIAPVAGTQLNVDGSMAMSALALADTGTLHLNGPTNSAGVLTLDVAGTLTGNAVSLTGITASFAGGSAVISNPVDFGTTLRTVEVTNAASTLVLSNTVSLGGGGSNRLIKTGAGTLVLNGANAALNKVALGGQAATPTDGGVISINNKDAIGTSQMFFNYGTLTATTSLTGANAIPVGLSVGGRNGALAGLDGEDMEFTGDSALFGATGTSGDIQIFVNNHSTFSGAFAGSTGTLITGFTVGGIGTLTFAGDMTAFLTNLRVRDTATVELNTATVGAATVGAATSVAPLLDVGPDAILAVGTVGTTALVTSHSGLLGDAAAALRFDIGGTDRGAATGGYDALVLAKSNNGSADVVGAVIFAGRIRADLINGFVPAVGQVFDLLDWDASVTPDFTGIDFSTLPDLSAQSLAWDTSSFASDGTIRVVNAALEVAITHAATVFALPGDPAVFGVAATGKGPITYQWRKDGTAISSAANPSAITPTLTISSASEADEGTYDCVVTNPLGDVTSDPASLVVGNPVTNVVATRDPASSYVVVGDAVTFSVTADGTPPFSYQWRFKGAPIPGANASTHVIASAAPTDAGDYDVLVSAGGPQTASNVVPLNVVDPVPAITLQPVSQMLLAGDALNLQIQAVGKGPLKYQWRKNGANIAGATAATYVVPSVAVTHGADYTCVVSGPAGKATSNVAQVGVADGRSTALVLREFSFASMKVNAGGKNLTFTWKRNGAALGADFRYSFSFDNRSFFISQLSTGDTGAYSCEVSGPGGTVQAAPYDLKVFNAKPELVRPISLPDAVIGGSFSYQIPVDPAPEKAPTQYTATGLPPGLKLDAKTGLITGKPTATKTSGYSIKLGAANAFGSDSETIVLQVASLPGTTVGVYTGPLPRHQVLNAGLGGRIDLTISTSAAFSGRLTLGALTYSFKGVLDADATGTNSPTGAATIKRSGKPAPPPLTLTFVVDTAADRLSSASVTDGTESLNLTAWRKVWTKTNLPLGFAGYYTFGIGLESGNALIGDAGFPQGMGYGSFTVSKANGTLALAGRTPDGELLSGSTFVGPLGEVLIFKTLYATTARGSIVGEVDLLDQSNADPTDNDLDGTLSLFRPANAAKSARTYAAGFAATDLTASGSYYVPPAAPALILGLTPGTDNALLRFVDGGIGAASIDPGIFISVGDKNRITLPIVNPAKTTLAVNATKGTLSGSFRLSDVNPRTVLPVSPAVVNRTVKYQGLIIRSGVQTFGTGYFLLPQLPEDGPPSTTTSTSPILSGSVTLRTNP